MGRDVSNSRQDERNHFQPKGNVEEDEPGEILDLVLEFSDKVQVSLLIFCGRKLTRTEGSDEGKG